MLKTASARTTPRTMRRKREGRVTPPIEQVGYHTSSTAKWGMFLPFPPDRCGGSRTPCPETGSRGTKGGKAATETKSVSRTDPVTRGSSPRTVATAASGDAEGADLRGICLGAPTKIIADVPDGAVVARVHSGLRVVFPSQRVLCGLSLDEHGFAQRQPAGRVAGETSGEPLASEVRCATKRVSDADIAELVDRRGRQPAEEPVGRVGALLMQCDAALSIDPELIPADAAATTLRVDRVHGNDRFPITDAAVDQPRHDLVALCVEAPFDSRLRHTTGQLAVA